VSWLIEKKSLQDACNAYANMEHYNCKGNCETLARCVCRVTGRRCTSLCHGGRGNNRFFAMCDDLEKCSNEEDESTKEDAPARAEFFKIHNLS
jgi:hypothetical protein